MVGSLGRSTPCFNPATRDALRFPGRRRGGSHYVWRLRGDGVSIETIDEKHAGPYAGQHARYVLRSKVQVLKATRAGEARHAA